MPQSTSVPLVTVAICTYNRRALLAKTLEALLHQQTPHFSFDVLVVDNASTDDTHTVVTAFQNRPVPVEYLYVPEPGVSHARNQAIDRITARFTAFLDDDAIPQPGWLNALIETFEAISPMPGAVGGRVFLQWTTNQPAWMPDDLLGIYSLFDLGDEVRRFKAANSCNIAFPTEIIRKFPFNTRLGVMTQTQLPGEETEVLNRMQRAGLAVYYQPGAVVTHVVGQSRENPRYVFARSRGLGYYQAVLNVLYGWPSRARLAKSLAREFWNRRNWWKRIVFSTVSGKVFANPRERIWVRSTLMRWFAFQSLMLHFIVRGSSAVRVPQTTTAR